MDRAKKFKLPPMEDTQGQRRKKLLEEQRRVWPTFTFESVRASDPTLQRRLLQVDSSRNINSFANLSLNDSSDEENQEPDTNAISERMEINPVHAERPRRAKKRKTVSKWANVVMYAEPMDFTSIPEDLQTDWIALAPVPKGKRCIMTTSRSSYSSKPLTPMWFLPLILCSIYRIPPQSR
jgi:snurportin-1